MRQRERLRELERDGAVARDLPEPSNVYGFRMARRAVETSSKWPMQTTDTFADTDTFNRYSYNYNYSNNNSKSNNYS